MLNNYYIQQLLGLKDIILDELQSSNERLDIYFHYKKDAMFVHIVIKVLKRNAYGMRNFNRFKNRILHMMA